MCFPHKFWCDVDGANEGGCTSVSNRCVGLCCWLCGFGKRSSPSHTPPPLTYAGVECENTTRSSFIYSFGQRAACQWLSGLMISTQCHGASSVQCMQLTTCTEYQAAGMNKSLSVMCVACSPYYQSFLYLRTFGRSGINKATWQLVLHAVCCSTSTADPGSQARCCLHDSDARCVLISA
jgi:hypothetical protein